MKNFVLFKKAVKIVPPEVDAPFDEFAPPQSSRFSFPEYSGIASAEGSSSKYLGHGDFGQAHEVVWNGKPAVMKIMPRSAAAMRELNNTKKIAELAAKAPPEVAQHLPVIFESRVVSYGGQDVIQIVMEKLSPSSSDAYERLFNPFTPANRVELVSNPEGIKNNLLAALEYLGRNSRAYLSKKESDTIAGVLGDALEKKLKEPFGSGTVADALSQQRFMQGSEFGKVSAELESTVAQAMKNIPEDIYVKIKSDPYFSPKDIVESFEGRMTEGMPIPRFPADRRLPTKSSESLWNAIQWLKSNGVTWGDVKGDNVMSRGGKPVLIDFGLYSMQNTSEAVALPGPPKAVPMTSKPQETAPAELAGKGSKKLPSSELPRMPLTFKDIKQIFMDAGVRKAIGIGSAILGLSYLIGKLTGDGSNQQLIADLDSLKQLLARTKLQQDPARRVRAATYFLDKISKIKEKLGSAGYSPNGEEMRIIYELESAFSEMINSGEIKS